ncbi:MAG: hypothetical protein RLZZ28_1549 [Bacteroidota bacterium]|jgi:hypothetical protein
MAENINEEHLDISTNTLPENSSEGITPTAGTVIFKPNQETEIMEVHHHAHHDGKKNWKSYFWEFLMLFLAVFCGFLAEYQLEHYIEKQRASEFAVSLHRDVATDTAFINRTIEQSIYCSSYIDSLIVLLANPVQLKEKTAEAYKYSVYAFAGPFYPPNESTLKQLLNSGALRYFKDNELVDTIKYYSNLVSEYQIYSTGSYETLLDFRKIQMKFIDINKVTEYIQKAGVFKQNGAFEINDLDIFKGAQLLTYDPKLLKEYSNWCALRKFYLRNSLSRNNGFITVSTSLLKLLKKNYPIE